MDDSVGLGICLDLALQSRSSRFPPLLILLSEMEEGFGRVYIRDIERTSAILKTYLINEAKGATCLSRC
ncbi:MAG: hypothetical protein WD266_11125 [Balneolales bacterium]